MGNRWRERDRKWVEEGNRVRWYNYILTPIFICNTYTKMEATLTAHKDRVIHNDMQIS